MMNERKERLNQIAQEFGLDIIYAFGSHAKEAFEWIEGERSELDISSGSDLDIGVKSSPGTRLSARDKVLLSMSLEDLFSVTKIDVVFIPEVDAFLAANIIREERVYCEYTGDEYELYVLRRAGDLAPFERERIALIMEDGS